MTNIPFSLRPYQEEAVSAILTAFGEGLTRLMFTMPTGCGKTHTFCALVDRLRQTGKPTLILCHREELIEQAERSFRRAYPTLTVGIEMGASFADPSSDIIIASVQTLAPAISTRLQWLADVGPSVIIYDECHHAVADGAKRILTRFGVDDGRTPLVGCTATPLRLDKQALTGRHRTVFERNVYPYSLIRAFEDHWLCPVLCYRVMTDTKIGDVPISRGDFNRGLLSKRIDVRTRHEKVHGHWRDIAGNRQTLLFCATVAHARHAAEYWAEMGVKAEYAHGGLTKTERAEVVARFKSGETQVLANVELFTEGFDYPELACIVMLRPTKSLALYTQMLGRGMRIPEGTVWGAKDLLLLDVTDNTAKHAPSLRVQTVTAPVLAGLPENVDLEGATLEDAVRMGEQVNERNRNQLADAGTLKEIKTRLKQIPVLPTAQTKRKHGKFDQSFVGFKSGELVVTHDDVPIGYSRMVTVMCKCGNAVDVPLNRLLTPHGKSKKTCGECNGGILVKPDMVFGQLTVYSVYTKTVGITEPFSVRHALCHCDCGSEKAIDVSVISLVRHRIKSCGCQQKQAARQCMQASMTKHGESNTPLHRTWMRLHSTYKIQSTKNPDLPVATDWPYEDYREWAHGHGYTEGNRLQRKNSHLPYSAENCRWVPAGARRRSSQ